MRRGEKRRIEETILHNIVDAADKPVNIDV